MRSVPTDRQSTLLVPSVEERLHKAKRRLELIIAALTVEYDQHSDGANLMEAALEAANDANEELYWLTKLPADVHNMDAPNADQAKAMGEL